MKISPVYTIPFSFISDWLRQSDMKISPVYTMPFSFISDWLRQSDMKISPVYTIPFSFISDWFMPLSERFHLKTRKRYEAYRIGAFSCKQEANPI